MNLKDILHRLRTAKDNILLIHYSCQNLGDRDDGLSPRIASIAVCNYTTSITKSFAIHLVAERRNISRELIRDNYDELEAELLSDFFEFVRDRLNCFWIHWNMSTSTYGFEALAHRYNVLTRKEAPEIDDVKKFNLIDLVCLKYGKNSIDDPKMKTLATLNGGPPRNWLDGHEEAENIDRSQFLRVNQSTIAKVYFFSELLTKLLDGKRIRTSHSSLAQKCDAMLEHPVAKLIGLLSAFITIYFAVQAGISHFGSTP